MPLAKAAAILCVVYGILFIVKSVLLFFRGGQTRG